MSKSLLNAIFYSKQDINLAYDVKMTAREAGISVLYAFEPSDLAKYLNELKVSVIFIDCQSIKISDSMLAFIKSYPNSKNPTVVCVNDSTINPDISLYDYEDVNHIICPKNLKNDMLKIENSLYYSHAVNSINKFNYSEINQFLTNYLISIGIIPKHIGFTFIKQAVELALKNNGVIGSLSREIYPTIASKNKTLPQNVERNIRNSIESACKSKEILKDDIKNLISEGKISNRVFLCYLLDKSLNTFASSIASIGAEA